MEGPDRGPEGRVDPWIRPARAPEPLPAPPPGYRFAGPDYLYAPPAQDAPDTSGAVDARQPPDAWHPRGEAAAPVMVWSAATSRWEPALGRPRVPGPPLPPALRSPQSWRPPSARKSRRLRRRRGASPVQALVIGFVILVVTLLVVTSLGATGGFALYMPGPP